MGQALTASMQNSNVFPSMVIQMCAPLARNLALTKWIWESCRLFEQEVDDAVDAWPALWSR